MLSVLYVPYRSVPELERPFVRSDFNVSSRRGMCGVLQPKHCGLSSGRVWVRQGMAARTIRQKFVSVPGCERSARSVHKAGDICAN